MTVSELLDNIEALGDSFGGGWDSKVYITDCNGDSIEVTGCDIQLDYENGHKIMVLTDKQ